MPFLYCYPYFYPEPIRFEHELSISLWWTVPGVYKDTTSSDVKFLSFTFTIFINLMNRISTTLGFFWGKKKSFDDDITSSAPNMRDKVGSLLVAPNESKLKKLCYFFLQKWNEAGENSFFSVFNLSWNCAAIGFPWCVLITFEIAEYWIKLNWTELMEMNLCKVVVFFSFFTATVKPFLRRQ